MPKKITKREVKITPEKEAVITRETIEEEQAVEEEEKPVKSDEQIVREFRELVGKWREITNRKYRENPHARYDSSYIDMMLQEFEDI